MGTPSLLLAPIVLIESVRLIIRPITLAVRLIANIMAGHLLLRLVGASFTSLRGARISFIAQSRLCVLELAVAGLQAYVFIVLLVLYSSEGWLGAVFATLQRVGFATSSGVDFGVPRS